MGLRGVFTGKSGENHLQNRGIVLDCKCFGSCDLWVRAGVPLLFVKFFTRWHLSALIDSFPTDHERVGALDWEKRVGHEDLMRSSAASCWAWLFAY